MIYKVTRITVVFLLTLLPAISASAQTNDAASAQTKEQDKKTQKKVKNGDVENIGNRNINKGNLNFTSLEKEIAMGRALAATPTRRSSTRTPRSVRSRRTVSLRSKTRR